MILASEALWQRDHPYGPRARQIVAIVTVFDLFRPKTRRGAYSRTFDFQIYIWAAIFYLVIVETLRNVWAKLEQRLTPPPQGIIADSRSLRLCIRARAWGKERPNPCFGAA